jgi:peptide/nickel transport system substrate-binding protein
VRLSDQDAHEITGVFALDDELLGIELVHPTPDFVGMLALPCGPPRRRWSPTPSSPGVRSCETTRVPTARTASH